MWPPEKEQQYGAAEAHTQAPWGRTQFLPGRARHLRQEYKKDCGKDGHEAARANGWHAIVEHKEGEQLVEAVPTPGVRPKTLDSLAHKAFAVQIHAGVLVGDLYYATHTKNNI